MVHPHKPEVEEGEVLFIQEVSVAVDSSLLLEGVVVPEKRAHHLQLVVRLAQVVYQVAVANLVEIGVIQEVLLMMDMELEELDGTDLHLIIVEVNIGLEEIVVIMVDLVEEVDVLVMVVVVPVVTLAVLVDEMKVTTAAAAVPIMLAPTRAIPAASISVTARWSSHTSRNLQYSSPTSRSGRKTLK